MLHLVEEMGLFGSNFGVCFHNFESVERLGVEVLSYVDGAEVATSDSVFNLILFHCITLILKCNLICLVWKNSQFYLLIKKTNKFIEDMAENNPRILSNILINISENQSK